MHCCNVCDNIFLSMFKTYFNLLNELKLVKMAYIYVLSSDHNLNKDENVHRFELSSLRGELLEKDRKRHQQIINKIEIDTNL